MERNTHAWEPRGGEGDGGETGGFLARRGVRAEGQREALLPFSFVEFIISMTPITLLSSLGKFCHASTRIIICSSL